MTEDDNSAAGIIARAQKQAGRAKDAWSRIYEAAKDDLRFLSDEPGSQWDEREYRERTGTGRPVIDLDMCSQFVHQVENDIRMNTPTIKCIPHGGGADIETAEMLDGLIKDIEYQSSADEAYDTAASSAVRCGIGFIRVDHEYVDDEGFDQQLCIKRVVNPFAVLIDPFATEIDGSDARYGFVFDTMSVSDFKEAYPGKEPCSFWDDGGSQRIRADEEEVVIAEQFIIEEEERELSAPEVGASTEEKRTRRVKSRKVRRYKMSGKDMLADTVFPGRYVPLVPVYGEEAWNDGQRNLLSLIRKAKSAAYMGNLWASLETEVLMKQPLAPVTAYTGQVENYAQDWLDPSKSGVLRHDPVMDEAGRPLPPPQRMAPPTYPAAFAQARAGMIEAIKGTTGMYNASLGQRSNETSGVAIERRKIEGDVATYHFADNLTKSITHVGRILVSAIPEIYDTPRILRTFTPEEEPAMVGVNGMRVPEQERDYDLTKARFTVRVVTGPSFTTQRQEATAVLGELMARRPELAQMAGDLLFKNMDFPGAQAVAERFKKLLPPQLREEDAEKAPDPEKLQMQQVIQEGQQLLAQLQQENQALKQQVGNKQADLQLKAQSEQIDAQLEAAKLRLEETKAQNEARFKAAELALKDRELALREAEMAVRATQPAPVMQ